ncbi:MAG: hypothetical protein QOD81_2216, partial [Solirubrobacteraceae bacterium]|nr:hypothetical protein [Solirubrobacteraceae bacterium]
MSEVMSRPVLGLGAFVDGRDEPLGSGAMEVRDPASGELVGRVTSGDAEAADRAVRAAAAAFPAWSERSV